MTEVLRRLLRRHGVFVLACGALLGLFQVLIAAAVGSVDVPGAVQMVLDSLPPFLQTVIRTQFFGGLSPGGLVAFGWNHPISHALGAAVAVLVGAHAIAGEIDTGAMELLLAQPLARSRYMAAQMVFAAGALAVTTALGLAGTALGVRAYVLGPFPASALARLGLDFWALQWAWFGLALLVSSLGREGGRAAGVGFLLALASYVAFVIGTVWPRAAFVLPFSLHHYFAPREILATGAGVGREVAILAVVGLVAALAALGVFRRRDLP